jgi:hypothetical protein
LQTVKVYEQNTQADLKPPADAQQNPAGVGGAKCEAFDNLSVAIDGAPRFQIEDGADRANAKRWYVYSVKVAAKGNGKFRLARTARLRERDAEHAAVDPASKSWSVEARHLRCTASQEELAPIWRANSRATRSRS